MAMAAPAHTEPPGSTTIDFSSDSMPEDVIQEILLRFPCSASVACAVYFNRHLRSMVSNDKFLKCFRQRHPSSPLLGIFASGDKGRLPLFENLGSDTILDQVICRTDTGLGYLHIDKKKDWLLEDCRNGRLLLCSNENSFCTYDPLSQRRVDCESRPYELDGEYLNNGLLYGPSPLHMVSVQQCGQSTKARESSFRVISLQRRRRSKSTLRAVEYDSRTLEWRPHPWKKFQSLECVGDTMHAAGHIFWACSSALLIVLDTETMKFSQELLPGRMGSCAIGELEDDKACAVCLQGLDPPDINGPIDPHPHLKVRLQVWTIEKKNKQTGEDEDEEEEEEGKARFDWKLTEDFLVSEILDKDARVYQVTKVVNGLVILSNTYSKDHYVINLHSKTRVAKFNNRGRQMPYLYQVPWPPSVMAATVASGHNKHIVGVEVNKQSPSNKDVASTIEESYGHIAGNEVSKQCPSNKKDGPATTEERYPPMTRSLNHIMRSMDQINLGENSPEEQQQQQEPAEQQPQPEKQLQAEQQPQPERPLNVDPLYRAVLMIPTRTSTRATATGPKQDPLDESRYRSLNHIMRRVDQINLGENSPEATVSSALVANTDAMMEQLNILQDDDPLNMSKLNKHYACHVGGCGKSDVQWVHTDTVGPTTTRASPKHKTKTQNQPKRIIQPNRRYLGGDWRQ